MGDMCISLSEVKSGYLPAAGALNRNGDDKVCKSENPGISDADFEAFVNTIRIHPVVEKKVTQIKIPEMVKIPAGKFKMGSTEGEGDEQPVREVQISAFRIGRYQITNAEYKAYLEANGREVPDEVADPAKARHAVVNVRWNEAANYCKWLSRVTGRNFRLPTEAEWEYAARGTEGRKYPWGNNWDASGVFFDTDVIRPVGSHPQGASPFGVMDMAGNVWEWVSDWYAGKYNPGDLVNPKGPKSGDQKVERGGSWGYFPDLLRGAHRARAHPASRCNSTGFRVAEDT